MSLFKIPPFEFFSLIATLGMTVREAPDRLYPLPYQTPALSSAGSHHANYPSDPHDPSLRLPPLLSDEPLRHPVDRAERSPLTAQYAPLTASDPHMRSAHNHYPTPPFHGLQGSSALPGRMAEPRDDRAISTDRRTPVSEQAFYGPTLAERSRFARENDRRRSSAASVAGSYRYDRSDVRQHMNVAPQPNGSQSTHRPDVDLRSADYPRHHESRPRYVHGPFVPVPNGSAPPTSYPPPSSYHESLPSGLPLTSSVVVPLGVAVQQYSVPCVISKDGTTFIPLVTPHGAFGHPAPAPSSRSSIPPVFDGYDVSARSRHGDRPHLLDPYPSRMQSRQTSPANDSRARASPPGSDQAASGGRAPSQEPQPHDDVAEPTSVEQASSSSGVNATKRLLLTFKKPPIIDETNVATVSEDKRRKNPSSDSEEGPPARELAVSADRVTKKRRRNRKRPENAIPVDTMAAPVIKRRPGRPPRPKLRESASQSNGIGESTKPAPSQAGLPPQRRRKKRWYAHRARGLSTTPVLSDEVERELRSKTTYPLLHERSPESEWVRLDDLLGPQYWLFMKGPVAERLQQMDRQNKGKEPTSAAYDREAHLPDYHAEPSKIPGSGKYIMDPMLARLQGGDETSQTGSAMDADDSRTEPTSDSEDESEQSSVDESDAESESTDARLAAQQLKPERNRKPMARTNGVVKKRSRPKTKKAGDPGAVKKSPWANIPRDEILARMAKVRAARGLPKVGVTAQNGRGGLAAGASRVRSRVRDGGVVRGRGRGRPRGRPRGSITMARGDRKTELAASSPKAQADASLVRMDDFDLMPGGSVPAPNPAVDHTITVDIPTHTASQEPPQPPAPKPKRMPKGYVIVTDDEDDRPPQSPPISNLDGTRATRRSIANVQPT